LAFRISSMPCIFQSHAGSHSAFYPSMPALFHIRFVRSTLVTDDANTRKEMTIEEIMKILKQLPDNFSTWTARAAWTHSVTRFSTLSV
jgi:hypothetical protein